jgi:hypothetical protein
VFQFCNFQMLIQFLEHSFFRRELLAFLPYKSWFALHLLCKRSDELLTLDKALWCSQKVFEYIINWKPFSLKPRTSHVKMLEKMMPWNWSDFDPTINNNKALQLAVQNNSLILVKYICSMKNDFPKIDISMENNYCFISACANGEFEVIGSQLFSFLNSFLFL